MTDFGKKMIFRFSLVVLVGITIVMGTVPPVSRDALTHHLAVPKIYVQNGELSELPHIVFSYYPQLLDFVYCIPLIFGNDIAPKFIHYSFALLTAWLIFFYLKKNAGILYARLGAVFFLTLPVIVKLSVTVYVDLGLIFFSTAALLCLLKWRESGFVLKWVLLSGVFCGLAMGCKYNGLVTLFILFFMVPLLYFRHLKGTDSGVLYRLKGLGCTGAFLVAALVVFSPWMIKNYIWTQNPVYPLYDSYFNPKVQTGGGEKKGGGMNHFLIRKFVYKESFLYTMAIPIRIFFEGKDDDPKYFDGRLNPLLFFLPILVLLLRPDKNIQAHSDSRYLFLFAALYIMVVFVKQDMRIRWMGPAIPPLVVLAAMGLKSFNERFNSKKRWLLFLWLAVGSLAAFNLVYIAGLYKKIDPVPYLAGKISRGAYIERFRPEYPVVEYANKNLEGDIKILAVFLGNRRYYSDHDIRFNSYFFSRLPDPETNKTSIEDKLNEGGFTHLIINVPSFNKWIASNHSAIEKELVHIFFKNDTELIYQKNGYCFMKYLH